MNKSVSVSRAITVEILQRRKHAPHGLHGLHATVCVFSMTGHAKTQMTVAVWMRTKPFNTVWNRFSANGFGIHSWAGFWIPKAGFRIPMPAIPGSTSKNFPDSGIRITLHIMGKAFDATNQNEISMLTFYFNIKVSMIWHVHIVLQHDNHLMMVCWPDGTPFKLPCGNFKSRNRS